MKRYTPIRQFYAWVGFATILVFGLFLLGMIITELRTPPAEAKEIPHPKPVVQVAAIITAYTSSIDETDSTPFENALDKKPGDGSVACPAKYKLGTQVEIKGKTYTCDDRMAKSLRGKQHFDIWVVTKKEAFNFGNQLEIVTILP